MAPYLYATFEARVRPQRAERRCVGVLLYDVTQGSFMYSVHKDYEQYIQADLEILRDSADQVIPTWGWLSTQAEQFVTLEYPKPGIAENLVKEVLYIFAVSSDLPPGPICRFMPVKSM